MKKRHGCLPERRRFFMKMLQHSMGLPGRRPLSLRNRHPPPARRRRRYWNKRTSAALRQGAVDAMTKKERATCLKAGMTYLSNLEKLFNDALQSGRYDLTTRVIWMHGGSTELLEQLGLLTHNEAIERTASLFYRWLKEGEWDGCDITGGPDGKRQPMSPRFGGPL